MHNVLAGVGRCEEAAETLRPLTESHRFIPLARYHYIYALWSAGRLDEAEAALEQAIARWPKHGAIWQARVKFLAHTGRPGAALALLHDAAAHPVESAPQIEGQTALVGALRTRSPEDVDRAMAFLVEQVDRIPLNAGNAMQYAASLGRLDDAFALALGHYLGTGRWAASKPSSGDLLAPTTALLFNPLTASMRADPRFERLSNRSGWPLIGGTQARFRTSGACNHPEPQRRGRKESAFHHQIITPP